MKVGDKVRLLKDLPDGKARVKKGEVGEIYESRTGKLEGNVPSWYVRFHNGDLYVFEDEMEVIKGGNDNDHRKSH